MPDAVWEPVEELLAAADAAGFRVSRPQLRRWQQAGMLPPPTQRGLGRARGTAVRYPVGATAQLVRLCELLNQHRSLRQVRWRLWWEGFPIANPAIRPLLEAQLQDLEVRREGLLALLEGPDSPQAEKAWDMIDRWATGRLPDRSLRRVRKRTGRERFETFVLRLSEIA